MNNAKMWLVVKPTVGIPLFLAGVANGSFAVHVAVLSYTTWVADFLSGRPLGTCMAAVETPVLDVANAAYVVPGSQDIMVRLPDGTMAHAVLSADGSTLNLPCPVEDRITRTGRGSQPLGTMTPPASHKPIHRRVGRSREAEGMLNYRRFALGKIAGLAPQFLPFAEVASAEVPLSRLLRLALFQVMVGMAMVLLAGTLNRVMIVELRVPAALVGVMLALPLLFAPFRALIGFRSDTFASALGLRRIPYIYKGTMLQFGGFAIMPFALLVLSGYGDAADAPRRIGLGAAALSFLLIGAGAHIVQTVGLALATDLVPEEDQQKVVGLMYVLLRVGMMVSAFVFRRLLQDDTPGRLIQVIQGAAVVTILLDGIALWKQEARDRVRGQSPRRKIAFRTAWRKLTQGRGMMRLLAVIGCGTAGFGMADVLLDPFGGQVLGMTVGRTTDLTIALALGGLIELALGARCSPLPLALILALRLLHLGLDVRTPDASPEFKA